MPEFNSYEETRDWFKGEFGEQFSVLKDSFDLGGQKCFEHHVVVDPVAYEEGRKQLVKAFDNGETKITNEGTPLVNEAEYSAMDYIMSYHPIQIMKDGSVHIVF
jgi:hypothetical protein